jgi:predicted DNA-binding protein with PD1-like motif
MVSYQCIGNTQHLQSRLHLGCWLSRFSRDDSDAQPDLAASEVLSCHGCEVDPENPTLNVHAEWAVSLPKSLSGYLHIVQTKLHVDRRIELVTVSVGQIALIVDSLWW